ncbi:hypothetical protein GJ744_006637 [Endocarpon pusillum]|uniref:Uncharacterized protein n=1 Tax=Endocarpon pusillum TaxID=364733 RepID=A0A8H7ARR7_9EURO|nr:hypothetical protein GJ744_006637 [Endocarpon pusillum]
MSSSTASAIFFYQKKILEGFQNDKRCSADNVLYSEWQQRIKDYSSRRDGTEEQKIARCEENPEELEYGDFFLAYPVPAYALWYLVDSLCLLDDTILGATSECPDLDSPTLRPLQYLLSDQIANLRLDENDSKDSTENSRHLESTLLSLEQEFYSVAIPFEEARIAWGTWEKSFEANVRKIDSGFWILECTSKAVEQRFESVQSLLSGMEDRLEHLADKFPDLENTTPKTWKPSGESSLQSIPLHSKPNHWDQQVLSRVTVEQELSPIWGEESMVDVPGEPHTGVRRINLSVSLFVQDWLLQRMRIFTWSWRSDPSTIGAYLILSLLGLMIMCTMEVILHVISSLWVALRPVSVV